MAEHGELRQADESVAVGVDLLHGTTEVDGFGAGLGAAEGGEDVGELVWGDLAVAVGVELVKEVLELRILHGGLGRGVIGGGGG